MPEACHVGKSKVVIGIGFARNQHYLAGISKSTDHADEAKPIRGTDNLHRGPCRPTARLSGGAASVLVKIVAIPTA